MSKSKKKKKINSPRGYDYTPTSAMFEDISKRSRMIDNKIITKSFNEYSDEELVKKSSEVTKYDLNKPIRYRQFKELPAEIQRQYILNLDNKYPNISASMLSQMFKTSQVKVRAIMREVGIVLTRGNSQRKTTSAKLFKEEMIDVLNEMESNNIPSEEFITSESVNHSIQAEVSNICFESDIDDVSDFVKSLGIMGRVRINLTPVKRED